MVDPGETTAVGVGKTTSGVPVKAEAGTVKVTVSGAVNCVVTSTHLAPFQYETALAAVKLGFVIEIVTIALGPSGGLAETAMS